MFVSASPSSGKSIFDDEPTDTSSTTMKPVGSGNAGAVIAKLPNTVVPGAAAHRDATKAVDARYRSNLVSARKPADRAAVAAQILDDSNHEITGSATRYIMLTRARDLAADNGDGDTALSAVDSLGDTFDVKIVAMSADVLTKLSHSVHSKDDAARLLPRVNGCLKRAVDADLYPDAMRDAVAVESIARASGSAAQVKLATQQVADVKARSSAFADARKAADLLKQNPADADANLKVGRFLCFMKSDWASGLPLLATSSNVGLKQLAKLETSHPEKPDAQVKVADGWWQHAAEETADAKAACIAHANDLYQQVLPLLSAPQQEAVKAKLGPAGAKPESNINSSASR